MYFVSFCASLTKSLSLSKGGHQEYRRSIAAAIPPLRMALQYFVHRLEGRAPSRPWLIVPSQVSVFIRHLAPDP